MDNLSSEEKQECLDAVVQAPPVSVPVAVQVVEPTDISKMETLDDLRVGVKAVLSEYENNRQRGEGVRRVDEIWDQVWKLEDSNQILLTVMKQGIVLFEKCYDEFLAEGRDDEEYLRRLEDEASKSVGTKNGDKIVRKFTDERKRIERKISHAHDNLKGYMDCIVRMSHEYRQCRTQQSFWFHISQLEQFTALIIASLHQQIHDANVLKKVSESIENASLKLFPQELKQDS